MIEKLAVTRLLYDSRQQAIACVFTSVVFGLLVMGNMLYDCRAYVIGCGAYKFDVWMVGNGAVAYFLHDDFNGISDYSSGEFETCSYQDFKTDFKKHFNMIDVVCTETSHTTALQHLAITQLCSTADGELIRSFNLRLIQD